MTTRRLGTTRFLIRLFRLSLVTLLLYPTQAHAGAVTLAWSANPEPDIAGYIVSYGTSSHGYVASIDVGNYTSFQFADALAGETYYFAVRAYNTAGLQSNYSQEVSYSQLSNLSITSFTSDRPSPQPPGSLISFSASAIGGTAPYEYRWAVNSQIVQDWSSAGTFSWKPTAAATYTISVFVRSSGSLNLSTAYVAAQNMSFTVAGSTLAVQGIQSSLPAPQGVNTTMTFTAAASGGTAPYQYKWFITKDAATWQIARDWSSSNWWNWTPSATGDYQIGVWVRSAGNSADAPDNQAAAMTIPFQVAGSFLRLTGITSNLPSSQPVGSSILFTAWSTGAASPQYRWWVYDNSGWVLMQDWSSSPSFLWTSNKPGSRQIQARVRDASGQAVAVDSMTTMTTTFGITGAGGGKGGSRK